MSPTISRILLTIVLFPLAGILNFIAYIMVDDHLDSVPEVLVPVLITCAFVVSFWLLLWRKTVTWTRRRVRGTLIAAAAAVLAAAAVGVIVAFTVPYSADDVAVWVGCALMPLLWIAGTLRVWRETDEERSDRLAGLGAGAVVC